MDCQIIWSPAAREDFRGLVAYIAMDKPRAAAAFGDRIIAQIETLRAHPRLGRVVPEFRQTNLREIIVSPYRIVYRIDRPARRVEIVRVWHAARNVPVIEQGGAIPR